MRDFLAGMFIFGLLPAWLAFMAYVIVNWGLNTAEAIGMGTINGVFLAAFKDMWQFYFRKKES